MRDFNGDWIGTYLVAVAKVMAFASLIASQVRASENHCWNNSIGSLGDDSMVSLLVGS